MAALPPQRPGLWAAFVVSHPTLLLIYYLHMEMHIGVKEINDYILYNI
jgi:hypothetical protein